MQLGSKCQEGHRLACARGQAAISAVPLASVVPSGAAAAPSPGEGILCLLPQGSVITVTPSTACRPGTKDLTIGFSSSLCTRSAAADLALDQAEAHKVQVAQALEACQLQFAAPCMATALKMQRAA